MQHNNATNAYSGIEEAPKILQKIEIVESAVLIPGADDKLTNFSRYECQRDKNYKYL